ncbi:MAG TPA: DUF362 domain-containing protein, partial [Isosphaeraceae bacterium]|nr:DUF362 domain-containing protein [Isosphaeraceae bacterium]
DILKRDNLLIASLTRGRGRARQIMSRLQGKHGLDGWRRLSAADVAFLRSVEAMNRNLVALSQHVRPHLSVVDGFVAMHREGPRHGTPIKLGTVIAGTDPVAVDAVAAVVMGFDPRQIGYLHYAQSAGLGVADLDAIRVVGDPIVRVARRCVPHSNFAIQRHWPRLAEILGANTAQDSKRGPHKRPRRLAEARHR